MVGESAENMPEGGELLVGRRTTGFRASRRFATEGGYPVPQAQDDGLGVVCAARSLAGEEGLGAVTGPNRTRSRWIPGEDCPRGLAAKEPAM